MAILPSRRLVTELVCPLVLLTVGLCLSLPCFRSGIEFEDEGCLAYGAVRVLEGQIPNRDFVSLQPPLSYYTAAAVFKILGTSLLSLRVFGVGLYLALLLLIYGIARQFNGRLLSLAAALPATILGIPYFKFIPFAAWQGNAAALMAVLTGLLALRRTSSLPAWALLAGSLTSITMLLRQDQGFYLLVALAVLNVALRFVVAAGVPPASEAASSPPAKSEIRNPNETTQASPGAEPASLNRLLLFWLCGIALILLPCGVYWAVARAWPDIVRQLVLFPITTYARTSSLPFPPFRATLVWGFDLIKLLYFLSPLLLLLVAAWLAARLLRRRFGRPEAFVTFLLVWSGLFYCQVLARSDVQHLLITLPPFFILAAGAFGWGLRRILGRTFLINTPLERGEIAPDADSNRFSGLPAPMETAEAVQEGSACSTTPLKRGVNETRASLAQALPAAWRSLLQPRALAAAATCVLTVALVAVFLWVVAADALPPRIGPAETLTLPRGGVRVRKSAEFKLFIEQLQGLAPANRSILCLPYQPMFYFLCERRNPTRWNYIWPGDQTPQELEALVEQARRDPPAFVLLNQEEAMRGYAPAVLEYVHQDYRLAADVRVWLLYLPRQ